VEEEQGVLQVVQRGVACGRCVSLCWPCVAKEPTQYRRHQLYFSLCHSVAKGNPLVVFA